LKIAARNTDTNKRFLADLFPFQNIFIVLRKIYSEKYRCLVYTTYILQTFMLYFHSKILKITKEY